MAKDSVKEMPIDAVILWVDGEDERHKRYRENKIKKV